MDFRIGIGYDVHRLVSGRALVLGGVNIPYDFGLLGHSDADVLLHAVMDAILGAMGLGDIGGMFPDNDEKYKGISSMILLESVYNKLQENNYEIVNIDTVIIAQKPKLSLYYELMRENIACTLKTEANRINVKATTEEGLGFTGDGSGMSAKAVVLIKRI